ncbi:MAG: hypothetical protein WC716_02040 [Chitinophagaceae bacterium]
MNYLKISTITATTLTCLTLFSCSKKIAGTSGLSQCINSKLVELRKGGCPSRDSLKQYTFQNKTVYVYQTGSCGADFASPVIDENCKELGFLGGFAGNQTINGEDFSKAIYVKTVWNN